jgi:hypothetical protein
MWIGVETLEQSNGGAQNVAKPPVTLLWLLKHTLKCQNILEKKWCVCANILCLHTKFKKKSNIF